MTRASIDDDHEISYHQIFWMRRIFWFDFVFWVCTKILDERIETNKNRQLKWWKIFFLNDDIVCIVLNDCLFWRKYQLFCKHIWQIHVFVDVIIIKHWIRFAWMFDDDDFEIYENITTKYVNKNMNNVIERSNKHLLKIRKIFDSIKNRYYEIAKYMKRHALDERHVFIQKWIDKFRLLTRSIRQQKMKQIINEIAFENDEFIDDEIIFRERRRRHYEIDNENEK